METNLNLVAFHDKELITTSSIVAEVFGMRHDNVLQAIENLKLGLTALPVKRVSPENSGDTPSPEFSGDGELLENHHSRFGVMVDGKSAKLENLAEQPVRVREHGSRAGQLITDPLYPPTKEELALEKHNREVAARIAEAQKNMIDSSKRQYFSRVEVAVDLGHGRTRMSHEYEMNRDGFFLLAMGFTGPKALEFKVQFIQEFNRLEHIAYDKLRKHSEEWLAIHDGDMPLQLSIERESHREQVSRLKDENHALWEDLQEAERKIAVMTKDWKGYLTAYRAIRKEAVGDVAGNFYKPAKAALRMVSRAKGYKDAEKAQLMLNAIEDTLNKALDTVVDIGNAYGRDLEAEFDEDAVAEYAARFEKTNF